VDGERNIGRHCIVTTGCLERGQEAFTSRFPIEILSGSYTFLSE
jgi:hypothetical protein